MEVSEIEILPFQPSQFPPTETSGHVEKHHGFLPNSECCKEQLHFSDLENVRRPFAFGRDPNTRALNRTRDWIAVREVPPNCMIENATHRVADFLPGTACKRFGFTVSFREGCVRSSGRT